MKKIFVLASSRERFDVLHAFLIENGYEHDYEFVLPKKVPVSSPGIVTFIRGGEGNSLPELCIVDQDLGFELNGEDMASIFQGPIARISMPLKIIYLLEKGRSVTLNKKVRYVYWLKSSPFEEVEEALLATIVDFTKTNQSLMDRMINSI